MTDDYNALTAHAALLDSTNRGRLRLEGDEHLDYLHRLSTNDTAGCPVEGGLQTVFCDPRGRIVELVDLCRLDAQRTMLFTGSRGAAAVAEWLDRFHFGEQVLWHDDSATTEQIEIVGPHAVAQCIDVLGLDVSAVPPWHRIPHSLLAQRFDWLGHPGVRLWGDVGDARQRLQAAGLIVATEGAREILRIEQGVPGDGELTLDHNPWEAGLGEAIHMNKGCYTGQEVIARLDTYDKVKQHLVGLRLERPVTDGAELVVDERPVGKVTSVCQSPRFGAIGLGYVRNAFCQPGTTVMARAGDGDVGATVARLPLE